MTDRRTDESGRRLMVAALACFILAAATGALFRAGLALGLSVGLAPQNIRHAHSHLMMFSWVTPVLFLVIGRSVARTPAQAASFRRSAWWALGLGVMSFPLFAVYGYGLARIGSAELPLAAMASGLNMLVWYVFAAQYVRARRGLAPDRVVRMWDVAVTFLVLSSLGAWGISVVTMAGTESMLWPVALTHLFLEYFTLGWLVAAVVGVWYASGEAGPSGAPSAAARETSAVDGRLFTAALVLFLVGTALSHIAGMPRSLVPDGLVGPARAAGVMVGAALILFFVDSAGRTGTSQQVSRWMAVCLGIGLAAFSLTPGQWWADVHPMRILYVHAVLLGVVSTALVGGIARVYGVHSAARIFNGTVLALLATLVTTTHLWPAAWRGAWVFDALFAGALLPATAAVLVLSALLRS